MSFLSSFGTSATAGLEAQVKICKVSSAILAISLLAFFLFAACTGNFLQKGWLYVPTSAYHTEPLPEWAELVQLADSALAKKCRGGENWSLDVFNRLYIGDINTLIVDYEVKKGFGGQCWQVHVQIIPKKVKGVYKTWYAWAGPIDTIPSSDLRSSKVEPHE